MRIIMVTGGTAAGKTWLCERLSPFSEAIVIGQDWFYKEGICSPRHFDEPEAIEWTLLSECANQLRDVGSAICPVYDYSTGKRVGMKRVELPKSRIVIIEGTMVGWSPLYVHADRRLFIESPVQLRRERRIARDTSERKIPHDKLIENLQIALDNEPSYVRPFAKQCDLIVSDTSEYLNSYRDGFVFGSDMSIASRHGKEDAALVARR